jgi:hypothetical protein
MCLRTLRSSRRAIEVSGAGAGAARGQCPELFSTHANGRETALFVEVKYHRASFARIGLGDRGVRAFSQRFWPAGPRTSNAMSGGSSDPKPTWDYREGKQNNIQPTIFRPENHPFPLDESAKAVAEWVLSA